MFARLFKRFARDDRGVFAVIFAVMAISLTAMAGAVVDYVLVDQVRARSQIALDAAALALQPEIYTKDKAQLQIAAQALLSERITDPGVSAIVDAVDVNTDNGQLLLRAELKVPMAFVALVGIDQMTTQIISQVTRKKLHIEASFVLDNSGSMGGTKIASLKTAAINAINILFYGTSSPATGAVKNPNTHVAIVPFTFFVNAGASLKNETWVDRAGNTAYANDNLDNDNDDLVQTLQQIDRIALIESMTGQSWKGCFESRPYPYSVDDTTPSAANPDTLFLPEFAPDEPGSAGSPDSGFNNSYVNDSPSSCDVTLGTCTCSYQTTRPSWCHSSWCTTTTKVCSYVDTNGTSQSCSCGGSSMSCTLIYTPTGLSNREKQERICKYAGASVDLTASGHEDYTQGPNAGCPNASIQPLTDNVLTLTTKVNGMVADGGTNIHEGVAWGFRTLSPTLPFTEGRNYGTATSKVIIMMTDGENTYWHIDRRNDPWATPNMNGTYYYMPYGYQYNDRLTMHPGSTAYQNSDGDALQLKMNTLTLEACTNAKNAGITIYTIGLQSPNQTTTNMLTSCASEPSKAYFPTQASELNTVFTSIAEQLSQLRIEK